MLVKDKIRKIEFQLVCRRKFKKLSRNNILIKTDPEIRFILYSNFINGKILLRFECDNSDANCLKLISESIFICKSRKIYSGIKKKKNDVYISLFFMNVQYKIDRNSIGYKKFENKKAYLKWKLKQ